MFGVSDIRSSSEKRFNLMLQDLNQQIEWLNEVLTLTNSDSEKFVLALDVFENEINNEIKADTEQRFQRLLREEIHPFYRKTGSKNLQRNKKQKIKDYFSHIFTSTDLFYHHRKNLDDSITLVNRKLADMLDESRSKSTGNFPALL